MSYHKDLDEYTRFELVQELARREKALHEGICTYCGRSGLVLPACKFPDRHREAGEQMQRLNELANKLSRVGAVNHVGFDVRGTQSFRSPGVNMVETFDTLDRGRFVEPAISNPPPCGKTGCPKQATHKVVGSLTYYTCDDHIDEIQRLVDSEL